MDFLAESIGLRGSGRRGMRDEEKKRPRSEQV
jgi:hypothetical protein